MLLSGWLQGLEPSTMLYAQDPMLNSLCKQLQSFTSSVVIKKLEERVVKLCEDNTSVILEINALIAMN
jgi:hypothetical protein